MPNVTAYVGRLPSGMRGVGDDLFVFWNYTCRRLFVVQTVRLDFRVNNNGKFVKDDSPRHWLEKIQLCLDTINFEHEDGWAYLVDKPTGPRIIHKPMALYNIPCDFLWAPRVDVSEIDMKRSRECFGRAICRGKEVDVYLASKNLDLRVIELETRAFKAIQAMDIAYDIVAHVFRGERLIGILTESSRGSRPIRASDRAAVYSAFAQLERAFILHFGLCDDVRILMDEKGRVRILDLHAFVYYAPDAREKLERDAQYYHWSRLQQIFDSFKEDPDYIPMFHPRFAWPLDNTILLPTPSPNRYMLLFDNRIPEPWDKSLLRDSDEKKRRRRKSGTKHSSGLTKECSKLLNEHPSMPGSLMYTDPPHLLSKYGPTLERPVDFRMLLASTAEECVEERPVDFCVLLAPTAEEIIYGGGSILEIIHT